MFKSLPSLTRSLIAVVLALAVGLVSAQERRPLQAADRWSLASVGDPQVSPEGDWIAYTVSRNDKTADESRSRIWMVPAAGGDPLPMTAGDVGSWQPRWSPDGRYLAFLSARDGKPAQVWVLNRHGGEAQMLTDTPQSVSDFAWSPDSKSLALVLQDLHPEQAAALAAGEEWTAAPKPWVIDREFFKQDYVGYLDRRRTHIYRFDLDDRQLHQLTGGDFDDSQPAWSPDGLQLAFVSKRVDLPDLSTNTDIFLVSAEPLEQGVQEPRRLTRGHRLGRYPGLVAGRPVPGPHHHPEPGNPVLRDAAPGGDRGWQRRHAGVDGSNRSLGVRPAVQRGRAEPALHAGGQR